MFSLALCCVGHLHPPLPLKSASRAVITTNSKAVGRETEKSVSHIEHH